MAFRISRRSFLAGLGAATAASAVSSAPAWALFEPRHSPFRVAVINDEITQDFGRACEIAAQEFGMEWIELRGMWNKNLLTLDANEVAEARRILERNKLRVTDIASPLFKVDWKDAAKPKNSTKRDQFNADFTFDQQDEVLERSIELAKAFHTDRVRCFDFWRLDDPTPFRAAINQKLLDAANNAGKKGIMLVLENEGSCNTATGAEAAKVLAEINTVFVTVEPPGGSAKPNHQKMLYAYLNAAPNHP